MTFRTMGDATHDAVAALPAGLSLVAGYDTGSPDIDWTAADWARFPGIPHVTIDQGFTGSPNLSANVRDVEFGAWTPGQAVNRAGWTAPRPTIYCTLRETGYGLLTTPGVLADGWRGDLWLSIPGWQPGQALPATPGCTIVAVQNDFRVSAYDLSVVLDPHWPMEAPVFTVPGFPGKYAAPPQLFIGSDGTAFVVGYGTDGTVWYGKEGAAAAVKLS